VRTEVPNRVRDGDGQRDIRDTTFQVKKWRPKVLIELQLVPTFFFHGKYTNVQLEPIFTAFSLHSMQGLVENMKIRGFSPFKLIFFIEK
jgi:hypothetical protein